MLLIVSHGDGEEAASMSQLTNSIRHVLSLAQQPSTWPAYAYQRAWQLAGPCPPTLAPSPHGGLPELIRWPMRYENSMAAGFVRPLLDGWADLVPVQHVDLPQVYPRVVVFEAQYGGVPHRVAVDFSDYTDIDQACLSEVAVYFKMQHLLEGYGERKVVPGGYIAARADLYANFCRFRRLRSAPSRHDVYGRFGLRFSREKRLLAVRMLSDRDGLDFVGGTGMVQFTQSLREAALSKVCIDMPGNGPFCHRLVEYLAVGCCVVAPPHATRLHAELIGGEHIAYCREDLSDLVEVVEHYVRDDRARRAMSASAARFFDEHLHRVQLADHYLRVLHERLVTAGHQH